MSALAGLPKMLSAKELGAIEQRAVTPGYGLRQAADIGLLLGEIKRLEQDNFALRDGLNGWKHNATVAAEKLSKEIDSQSVIGDVSAVVDELRPHLEGTLAERVRQAIKGVAQ